MFSIPPRLTGDFFHKTVKILPSGIVYANAKTDVIDPARAGEGSAMLSAAPSQPFPKTIDPLDSLGTPAALRS